MTKQDTLYLGCDYLVGDNAPEDQIGKPGTAHQKLHCFSAQMFSETYFMYCSVVIGEGL